MDFYKIISSLNLGELRLNKISSILRIRNNKFAFLKIYCCKMTKTNIPNCPLCYLSKGWLQFWGSVITFRSFSHSWLITGFLTRVTRRVPHVEQELPTLPEHMSSPPDCCGVHVIRFLVLCAMFCRSLFVLLSFFFCPSCFLSFFDLRILITPFGILKLFLQ